MLGCLGEWANHCPVRERLVGIDVGGSKMLSVAIERSSPTDIVARRLIPTPADADGIMNAIIELAEAMGVEGHLGIGLAGLVEDRDVLRAAPNLKCMIDVPVRRSISDALGVAVEIENDATCALLAEMSFGVATAADDVVLVTLGTGIGGGVAIGRSLRRGTHGFAGEPGHMCVDPSGPLCVCGRYGCWERFASGTGVVWLAQQRGLHIDSAGRAITAEALVEMARAGDGAAIGVWSEFAGWLARGLANIADLLDPDLFVIGGGLVDVADLYLDRTRSEFFREVLGGAARTRTQIEPARSGPSAGAIGAALLH